jgi:hypothetical protein
MTRETLLHCMHLFHMCVSTLEIVVVDQSKPISQIHSDSYPICRCEYLRLDHMFDTYSEQDRLLVIDMINTNEKKQNSRSRVTSTPSNQFDAMSGWKETLSTGHMSETWSVKQRWKTSDVALKQIFTCWITAIDRQTFVARNRRY